MNTISWILVSVLIAAAGQVLLKIGADKPPMIKLPAVPDMLQALTNPYVITGLFCYFLSVVFWVRALKDADLSFAYPFMAIGIIITMVFSVLFLGEKLTLMRIAGTLFVAIGVVMIARS